MPSTRIKFMNLSYLAVHHNKNTANKHTRNNAKWFRTFFARNTKPSKILSVSNEQPRYAMSNRKVFSSFSDRFWDMVNSGTLIPTNVITDFIEKRGADEDVNRESKRILDFSRIRPHHLEEAAIKLQAYYDAELSALEDAVDKSSNLEFHTFRNVVVDLDRISYPVRCLQNIIVLLSNLKNSPEMDKALHSANGSVAMKHERSKVILDALEQLSEISTGKELDTIQSLIQICKSNGAHLDNDNINAVNEIKNRRIIAEQKFLSLSCLTMEEHGKEASAKDLVPLMYEILTYKKDQAKVLGYNDWAEMHLDSSRMAKGATAVRALHDYFTKQSLSKISSPEFKSKISFLQADDYLSDLSPYFELDNVLKGFFEFCQKMFGLRIVEESDRSKVLAWDKDVRLFHLHDEESNDYLASFYIDPFKRKYKSQGEFMAPLINKSIGDGLTRLRPVVALSLNIQPPVWDELPTQMEFNDVVALFHEFGHGLQYMLSDVEPVNVLGTQIIEEDASEMVSQFMEYWLFQGTLLGKLSKHNESGDTLPAETIDILKKRRVAMKLYELAHRLFLGQLELEMHSTFDPRGKESIIALQRKYSEIYFPQDVLPKGNIDPIIQIFDSNSKGKNVAQYRYIWSEVMSADAFESFQESGLENSCKMQKLGRDFRRAFLEGKDLNFGDSFKRFRGRDATPEAFLNMLDLK